MINITTGAGMKKIQLPRNKCDERNNMQNGKSPYVCPAEFAGSLDNSFRRWFHKPQKILSPYIMQGMSVLDLGCGPGVFTVELAKLVGESGKVVAADLQDGMLEIVGKKVKGTALAKIVSLHKCQENSIGIIDKVDFVLAFWMVHEVPDHIKLFEELKSILKPDGWLYIIEPKFHVHRSAFIKMSNGLISSGFRIVERPKVFFSRAILLKH
jgi:ubiquinone/menaquinone biosynthesis C-methylase UbiE